MLQLKYKKLLNGQKKLSTYERGLLRSKIDALVGLSLSPTGAEAGAFVFVHE